jgi:hypothetical protein
MNKIVLIFILFLSILSVRIDSLLAQDAAGGLRFYSQDKEFTKRTSFTLFNDYQPITDSLSLDFDFKIYDSERFGYIFRLIDKASAESETPLCHFLCHPEFSEGRNTLFFIQNNKKSGKILISKKDKKWIPFSLKINCLTKSATITCNDSIFRFPIDLPQKLDINVVFGLLLRNNAEVAAFDIRNVHIKISQKREYYWPLHEISGDIAYETRQGIESEVKNPNWLIKQHFYWNKIFDGKSDVMAGIDFDQKSQNIILVNQDSMLYFNVLTNKTVSGRYSQKRPFAKDSHFSVINPKTDELISYDFHFLKANGTKAFSTFDPEKQSWTLPENSPDQEENHLHVMFWNNDTTKLIKFGGYAHYKFFNDFRTFDFVTQTWQPISMTGDAVYPRSHAAIGKNSRDRNYYLFGGLGNKEGEQVLGVQNYYDLYLLDFEHSKSQKIWEMDNKSLVFMPRSQMIVEPSDSSGYILCNQSDKQDAPLCLYKFSLNRPYFEIVSDSLPSNFYNIADNAFLFKNNQLNELYCVIRQTMPNKTEAQVTIYKLNFPPTRLTVKPVKNRSSFPLFRTIAILFSILSIAAVYLIYRRKDKEQVIQTEDRIANEIQGEAIIGNQVDSLSEVPESETENTMTDHPFTEFIRPRANAIWVLGKFAIFDKKGHNITHLCSSKIKSLFFLIFLSSFYDDGISSEELSDILWPGMDKTRTKNNRSVTMNHLRKIFEDMEGISLVHENRNWKISFDETVYIDLVDLSQKLQNKALNTAEIIGLCSLGNLLQDEKIPELDNFKGNFETETIELLNRYCDEFMKEKKYAICYEIANIIHNHYDELNERALQIKLFAMARLRHFNKARQEYDNFCQRFKLMMDMEFTIPFNQLTEIRE